MIQEETTRPIYRYNNEGKIGCNMVRSRSDLLQGEVYQVPGNTFGRMYENETRLVHVRGTRYVRMRTYHAEYSSTSCFFVFPSNFGLYSSLL